jgi:hypothetical protein
MTRLRDLQRFYQCLDDLALRQGGPRPLNEVMRSPMRARGAYFFFRAGEVRTDSGTGARVVRVGAHALRTGAQSTLRGRLRQQHGSRDGRGNHRGSIFRLLVGQALLASGAQASCASWGVKGEAKLAAAMLGTDSASLKIGEQALERAASAIIGAMPTLTLPINDLPGPASLRGWIERNAIALLSNEGKAPIDAPSEGWLGRKSNRVHVRASGLWNQEHVGKDYDPSFLDDLQRLVHAAS